MLNFYQASFVIDSIPGTVFDGFTDGDDWNGWACPYFTRSEAERVVRLSERNGFRWRYDQSTDSFEVNQAGRSDIAPEVFESKLIEIDGKQITVYPIGAYSWIWETSEEN